MPGTSDLALLSSLRSQLDDLFARVEELADRYGETPDSSVAQDLYAAERALGTARRALARATQGIEDLI